MKSILISIQPKWCEKIVSGEKTIEVRKSAPKEVPFKAYIYATKPKRFYKCGAVSTSDELLWLANGKVKMGDGFNFWADGDEYQCLNGRVIGEFVCDKVYNLIDAFGGIVFADENLNQLEPQIFRDMSCLTDEQTANYLGDKDGYGLHITDLKIYDKPKELSEFRKPLDSVYCSYYKDYCEEGCVGFGSTDYVCNDYWKWEKGLTRPPQSWQYVEEIGTRQKQGENYEKDY